MELSLTPSGGYFTVATVAVVLLLLLLLGPARDQVSWGRRAALVMLRLLVIAVVILAMLRPALVHTTITKQSATLILLVDRSRSMLVVDTVGQKTRWEALQQALDAAKPVLDRLAENLEIRFYTFDAEAHLARMDEGSVDLGGPPDGRQTAIGSVLDDVLRREEGKRLVGVVLLSDGAQRSHAPRDLPPQVPARRMSALGTSLYTVAFGQARGPGQAQDVALENLLANEHLFVKNPLVVRGSVRLDGFVNQQIPVQLLVETSPGSMEVVAATQVQVRQDGERVLVELQYVPQTHGEFKVTLKAVNQPGELVTTNNEISTFVTVLKGGLNVLYLEGAARVEQKFLRRSLDASPDIMVDYLRIDAKNLETRPPDLAERFKPGKYDVVIFGDLDSVAFTPEELADLVAAVDRGAGFIMLGGFHSFGPGGYGQTVLADLLPIEIDRLERQNFGEPIRSDLHLAGEVRMRPTRIGETQSLMQLGRGEQNQAAWSQLPALEGANRFRQLKPGANVLAETDNGEPLLVAKDFGNGRVLAFAGDSTWHWWMSGHQTAHKRFWRQAVLWLARKDQTSEGNVWIKLDQRRFSPGSQVQFTVGARTSEGDPIPDARFTAQITLPDGTGAQPRLRRDEDEMIGQFLDTLSSGDYVIEVQAEHDDGPIGATQARFLVFEQDLELDNPAADRGALESLAAMTEGKSIAPEQLPALLEELWENLADLEVKTQIKATLWDTWPFLLLFVCLVGTEWYLRKKWGLV